MNRDDPGQIALTCRLIRLFTVCICYIDTFLLMSIICI